MSILDLAFALPAPADEPGDPDLVAVGVMEYRGSNDERSRADEIYSAYVAAMKQFVRWLVDNGRKVRLFVGDTNGSDDSVVQEILADLRESRPDLDPSRVIAEPAVSFADVMRGDVAVRQRGRDPLSQPGGRAQARPSRPYRSATPRSMTS